jgi:cold shock CspA family protein
LVDELDEKIKAPSEGTLAERAITGKVQEIENVLVRAQASSADDPFVLQVEARYRDVLEQDARAFFAIKKAHGLNPSIAPIARRLSRLYLEQGEKENALTTLAEALQRNPTRELWFEMGKLISEHRDLKTPYSPIDLFQKAFDKDDDQVIPRLYLLREYWRNRQIEDYRQLQWTLRRLPAPRHLRSEPNLVISDSNKQQVFFKGVVDKKEADYAFIKPEDGYPDVFVHRSNVSNENFDALQFGSPLSFAVGFTTKGAAGLS